MTYKALISFCGPITMTVGETREIPNVDIAQDLLKAGFITEVKPAEKAKEKATETAPEKKEAVKTPRKKRG